MALVHEIRELAGSPEQLETAYRGAQDKGQEADFAQAVEAAYETDPGNLLLAAWHYRLAGTSARTPGRAIAWARVLPAAFASAFLLWALSSSRFELRGFHPFDPDYSLGMPAFLVLAAPVSAAVMIVLATGLGLRRWRTAAAAIGALAVLVIYALWAYTRVLPVEYQVQYVAIAAMSVTICAWLAIGACLLRRRETNLARFSFLAKSLEAIVVGGLFAVAGSMLVGVCAALFNSIGVEIPEAVFRLFAAGGAGFIAIVAAASVYDPRSGAGDQSYEEGLSKVIAMLMRLLLPASLIVLAVFLALLPANYREPLENRDVLISFNVMLFAAMALLVGATPTAAGVLDERSRYWLRLGTGTLALLAVIAGVYSLAAILYRTAIDQPTPNRLAFIGWNVINVAVLTLLLVRIVRSRADAWLPAVHRTLSQAVVPYGVWSVALCLALPWVFRADVGSLSGLPTGVQLLAVEEAAPILLKCGESDAVYLLEGGSKRWIKDIATFEQRGYRWHQVHYVECADLEQVPLGAPIPADAGLPPAVDWGAGSAPGLATPTTPRPHQSQGGYP